MDKTRGLWRGKHGDVDSSEWLVGYLIKMRENFCLQDPQCENNVAEVDPSTLGECTGLTDKNGKLIFEGDILRHNSGTLHEVVFEQRNGKAYFGWLIDKVETWQFDWDFLRQLEVISNIHDNPELLKGEQQ